jgi:hypothetical protein
MLYVARRRRQQRKLVAASEDDASKDTSLAAQDLEKGGMQEQAIIAPFPTYVTIEEPLDQNCRESPEEKEEEEEVLADVAPLSITAISDAWVASAMLDPLEKDDQAEEGEGKEGEELAPAAVEEEVPLSIDAIALAWGSSLADVEPPPVSEDAKESRSFTRDGRWVASMDPTMLARLPPNVMWTQLRLRSRDVALRRDPHTGRRILFAGGAHGPIFLGDFHQTEICVTCLPAKGRSAEGLSSPEGRDLVLCHLGLLMERNPMYVVHLVGAYFQGEEARVVTHFVKREAGY